MSTKGSYLGVGVYSIADAARLVGASPKKIRRWLDVDEGLVSRRFDPSEQVISFLELMELQFINLFRDAGVSLQTIRKAAIAAANLFETDYPFAVKRFDTDGKTVFATLVRENTDTELTEDLRRGQLVFTQIIRPFFKKLDYGQHEALMYWPLDKRHRVVLDPERRFGQPIDAPTGVPTYALYDAVRVGQEKTEVAKWFDVPLQAVEDAVQFEQSLV